MTHPPTIIVVDDDASMNQALERIFHLAGLRAVCFSSAEALLESGAARDAAAFVLDVRLPGLTGFELRARLIEGGLQAPAFFITAHDQPAVHREAKRCAAAGLFIKPFSGRELIEAILRQLQPA